MILELFSILLIISLAIMIIGFVKEVMVYATVGFFFVFLLSFVLINNQLEYPSGATVNEVNATSTQISYNYSYFPDSTKTYGIYLAIASAAAMALTLLFNKEIRWGAQE